MKKNLVMLALFCFLFLPSVVQAKDWDPRLLEASRLAYSGQVDSAKNLIQEYISANPNDPNGYFVQGIILDWEITFKNLPERPQQLEILKIYKDANDLAFHLWEKDPENVDHLIDLGNSYLFLGRKYGDTGSWFQAVMTSKKCQQHLEKAQKLAPDRVDGLLALGGFHYLAANAPPGAAIFKGLLGIKGSKPEGLAEMNRSLEGKHPFVIDAEYALLNIQSEYEKNYTEALKILDDLEKKFPNNPELKYIRPQTLEKQDPKSGRGAYLAFATWCQGNAGSCSPYYLFRAHFDAGRVDKDLGDEGGAEKELEAALPYPVEGFSEARTQNLFWLGQFKEKKGEFSKALNQYEAAQKIPNAPKSLKKEIEEAKKKLCENPAANLKC